jgi:tagatose-1,6-bisphosphate aldolase
MKDKPIDYDAAVAKAKDILEKSRAALHESEELVRSLELLQAWPDIFDKGGFAFVEHDKATRAIRLRYEDGTEVLKPVKEAPSSYLAEYSKRCTTHSRRWPQYAFGPIELLRRKRAEREAS